MVDRSAARSAPAGSGGHSGLDGGEDGSGLLRRRRRIRVLWIATTAGVSLLVCVAVLRSISTRGMYVVAGQTTGWWSGVSFLVAAVAGLVAMGAATRLILARIQTRRARVGFGVLAVLIWVVGVLVLGCLCLVALFTLSFQTPMTFITAEDGTTLMFTQDVWMGESVTAYYDPGPGFSWIQREENPEVDPLSGPCTLTTAGSTMTITCGSTRQTMLRP